jgi:hypothetical protein
LRDQRKICVEIFDLFAEEITGDRRVVIDEEAAFAVEQAATGGEDRNLADPVGLCEGTEIIRAKYLEAPETGDENDENSRNNVLGRMKFARRDFFGLAVRAEVIRVDMVG